MLQFRYASKKMKLEPHDCWNCLVKPSFLPKPNIHNRSKFLHFSCWIRAPDPTPLRVPIWPSRPRPQRYLRNCSFSLSFPIFHCAPLFHKQLHSGKNCTLDLRSLKTREILNFWCRAYRMSCFKNSSFQPFSTNTLEWLLRKFWPIWDKPQGF